MKHTPTPLAIGLQSDDERTQIIGKDGSHICYVEYSPDKKIAAEIVRACNAHGELLETVKDIERWFSDELISSRHTRLGELVLEKLRPVIAKAEGK